MQPHEVLKAARMRAGYGTAAEAATVLGINEGTYRAHENGSRGIPANAAKRYARLFKVEVNDILFPSRDLTREKILKGGDDKPGQANIPVYGFKAGMGGGGIILDEDPIGYLPVSKTYLRNNRLDANNLIAIEVEGDSMSPTLETGDQVLINRTDRNPARGGIFALHDSDTLVVKRVERIPASDPVMLRLISDNQNHSHYDVLADQTNIIGRVVWFSRRI